MSEKHAIAILKKDHDTVKDLFDEFEKAESPAEKETIIGKALTELKIHALSKKKSFTRPCATMSAKDLMNEADEEHHVARVLIAELDVTGRRTTIAMQNLRSSRKASGTTSGKKKTRCCRRPKNST